MTQSFFVPGPLPGANDIVRQHRMVYHRLKVEWGKICFVAIHQAKIKPVESCRIAFRWQEKDEKRDIDNICFGAKVILDALVTKKILRDDRRRFVRSLTHEVVTDAANPGVLVTIEDGK